MKIKLSELKEYIFESYLEDIKEKIIMEDFSQRRWTGKDIHDKIQNLLQKSSKLRKIANLEKKERKIKMYSRLSNELMDLAEKLTQEYEITKDPNVIYKVYKEFGFDPARV